MPELIEVSSNSAAIYSIENKQISSSYVLSTIPPVFSDIEGQAFILEENGISENRVYDKSNLIDTLAEVLFDIDLDFIPSGPKLCQLAVAMLEDEEASGSDDLCLIISTWNSVNALRKLTKGPALELELVGSHKVQDQRAVQLFSIQEQDYQRPRLRRFTVFVCKLHRGVRI